ncbi:response regulator [Jannaschia marina]|uniref:response regulator n=1 Tax=Jannaschia marina TaxID=2741674 RepID=UPI0015C6D6FB|nr:response regulator [Jannaschia marina]
MSGPDDDPDPPPAAAQLLAHDIRSAVSDVIGGVRLMDRDALEPDLRRQLDRVQTAAELLARLVEELLHGTPRDTVGPIGNLNLHRFCADELRRWHGAAEGTGIVVNLDRTADVPKIVQLPLLPLRRVVANMMSNALRHSGGTRVTLGSALQPDGTLRISVQDDGRGLPGRILRDGPPGPAEDETSPAPRNGMGLQIVAAHARGMGARCEFGTSPMGGAEVVLAIPRAVWSRLEEPEADAALPDLSGHRILVADDSATNRLLVQGMLTQMGAECELAADGIEALNWLARERFDLALVDIEMPALGGLDVLRSERLRQARGVAPPTSMVAMTAYVLRDNRDAIVEAGADGILAKPLGRIEAFGAAIRHFLADAPDASSWVPEAAPPLSAATLVELMQAAGSEYEADLLARLSEDLADVEAAMTAALAVDDRDTLRAQTHVLLSLSSAVGALPTQQAARHLNQLAAEGAADLTEAAELCLARLAEMRVELAKVELP